MADHKDDDRTLPGAVPGMNRTPETDPEHLIPAHTHAAAPGTIGAAVNSDPDAVRDEIERTRQRMSQTINHIEGALQRKKGEIQEKLDIVAPVRDKPWMFAAGVFGTGLVLGLLTGGRDDDGDTVKVPRSMLAGMGLEGDGGSAGGGRAGAWDGRSRDLLQVVARQEEEIRDLRAAMYGEDDSLGAGFGYDDEPMAGDELMGADALRDVDVDNEWDEDWNYDDSADALDDFGAFGVEGEGGGFLRKAVTAAVAAGLAGAIGGLGKKFLGGRGGDGEMDVEVDLEPRAAAAMDVRVDPGYLAARRARGPGYGEMDVEVDLDRTQPYGAYGRPAGYGRELGYDREMDVEVDLERSRSFAGDYQPPRGRSLPVSPLAGAVAAGAAALVGGLVAKLMHDRSRGGEMDVEVEQPRPAYRAPSQRPAPTRRAAGGELEVEVELESRGHTSSPQPLRAEGEYEVELENPHGDPSTPRSTQGDAPLM